MSVRESERTVIVRRGVGGSRAFLPFPAFFYNAGRSCRCSPRLRLASVFRPSIGLLGWGAPCDRRKPCDPPGHSARSRSPGCASSCPRLVTWERHRIWRPRASGRWHYLACSTIFTSPRLPSSGPGVPFSLTDRARSTSVLRPSPSSRSPRWSSVERSNEYASSVPSCVDQPSYGNLLICNVAVAAVSRSRRWPRLGARP